MASLACPIAFLSHRVSFLDGQTSLTRYNQHPLPGTFVAVAKLDSRLAPAYPIAQAAHYLRFPVPPVRSWVHAATYEEIMDALVYERAA